MALTAITADGRLLTHALPAKAEPPASPPASLDGAPFSVSQSCFLSPPYLFPSHLLAVFAPTSDLPFIVAISRKRRESLKHGRLSPRCRIANFVTVIILTDESTLDTFNYFYTDKHWIGYNVHLLSIIPKGQLYLCIFYSVYNICFEKKFNF